MSLAQVTTEDGPFSVCVAAEAYAGFHSFDDAEQFARKLVTAQRKGAEIRHVDGLAARVVPHDDGGTRTDVEQLGVMLESARGAAVYQQAMQARLLLQGASLPFRTAKVVRDSLIGVLARGRIAVAETPRLGLKTQPTLFLPEHGIALEFVSKFEFLPAVCSRLEYFATHPAVQALLLVRHGDIPTMPVSIGGKPLLIARVGGRR